MIAAAIGVFDGVRIVAAITTRPIPDDDDIRSAPIDQEFTDAVLAVIRLPKAEDNCEYNQSRQNQKLRHDHALVC